MKSLFNINDKVVIKHQRDLGECVVVNPYKPTDMLAVVTGKPIEYYVVIDTPKAKNQGYHAKNLEKV